MKSLVLITLVTILALIVIHCGNDRPEPVPRPAFTAAGYLIDSLPAFKIRLADSVLIVPYEQLGQYLGPEFKDLDQFDPLGLATARYHVGEADLSVELMQYQTLEDAYGAYALRRPDGIELVRIGGEAYAAGVTLNIVNGDMVMKLSAMASDSMHLAARTTLARELVSRMPQQDPPGFFLLFPMRWQIKPSYHYWPDDYLGADGLDAVYTINYDVDGVPSTFFLTEDLSGDKYIKLSEYAKSLGEVSPAPDTIMFYGNHGIQFEHPEHGRIVAGIVRGKVVGVTQFQPELLRLTYLWVKGLQ